MLKRVRRKWNPLTLLVGMQTSTATMENMWKFLKKLETELPYDLAIPLLGIHTEETRIERDTCTPVFIAAPFTIARTWKQPRCPSATMDKEVEVHIHNGVLLSYKKQWIWVSSNEMDETGAYYTEWNKLERETPVQYINTYLWGNSGNSVRLYFGGLQNHCRWWLQPWN